MDPFFSLILLCIAMLVASFLAGNIPLSFHLSDERLKLISNFGVGLLVGTALVVIIPEGVETLYSSPFKASPSPVGSTNTPNKRSYIHADALVSRDGITSGLFKRYTDVIMKAEHASLIQDQLGQGDIPAPPTSFEDNMLLTRRADKTARASDPSDSLEFSNNAIAEAVEGRIHTPIVKRQKDDDPANGTPDDHNNPNQDQPGNDHKEDTGHDHDHEEEEGGDVHKYIGLALLSGFILMFLIDQMGPTHAHSHANHVSVADFTELHNLQLEDNNIRMPSAAGLGSGSKKRGNPITIGLVVHAAADGIALGASASRPELRFIVFLAIMLHKAPAAFGLASVLLQHGFSRRQTRQQVGIFALAAPIGAVFTYTFIQMSGQHDEALLHWWTGMLLLFSGGTFLYVAMHVMSDLNHSDRSSSSSGYVGGTGGDKGLSIVEVLCVIGGMVVPLMLAVDHEH
ncbi:MAG: ZIP zinc transporter-domain-containing protein [Benniella sp.]|nr:MAG: ZIP zinc transporter-domain-containing protein [Benniella sp.]